MRHRQTKACSIPAKVKAKVWARDGERCIFCGSHNAAPEMHFIPRSHGGLGIEENIGTGCRACHDKLDNSTERKELLEEFRQHLQSKYPEWDETKLRYRKWSD